MLCQNPVAESSPPPYDLDRQTGPYPTPALVMEPCGDLPALELGQRGAVVCGERVFLGSGYAQTSGGIHRYAHWPDHIGSRDCATLVPCSAPVGELKIDPPAYGGAVLFHVELKPVWAVAILIIKVQIAVANIDT